MLKKMYIKEFRGIKEQELEIANRITIFAGKNGTQKSTLLGLLAQPFVFYGKKHKNQTEKFLTLFGTNFEAQFSDLFKFSKKYDIDTTHPYEIELDKKVFEVSKCYLNTKKREENELRIIHYQDNNYKKYSTFSNFIYPVLYLGLSRLFPIGESEKIKTEKISNLDENLRVEFKKLYNKVLKQTENFTEEIIEKNIGGKTIGIDTGYYDGLTNSSGQDNVGKIIASLLSFKKLKEEYKNYKGGLLLIDELDASLFVASQITLFDILESYAKSLNLQIIFTTHSLELLKHIKHKSSNDTILYYLLKIGKKINIEKNPDYKNIYNNIRNIIEGEEKKEKIKIYTEDQRAADILKKILKESLKITFLDIIPLSWDWKTIMKSNKNFLLYDRIFIYDGDVPHSELNQQNELKLPFTKALEVEMLNLLKNEEADSIVWDKYDFTKEYFLDKIENIFCTDLNNTESCKNILKDEKFYKKVENAFFTIWKKENSLYIKDFIKDLEEKYKKIQNLNIYRWDEIIKMTAQNKKEKEA